MNAALMKAELIYLDVHRWFALNTPSLPVRMTGLCLGPITSY